MNGSELKRKLKKKQGNGIRLTNTAESYLGLEKRGGEENVAIHSRICFFVYGK